MSKVQYVSPPTGRILVVGAGVSGLTTALTLARADFEVEVVAELFGHARLETTRAYTRPSAEDRTRALDQLLVDK